MAAPWSDVPGAFYPLAGVRQRRASVSFRPRRCYHPRAEGGPDMLKPLAAMSLLLAASAPAAADISSAAPGGFELRSRAAVHASPARVWAMLGRPSLWWDPKHSWSGDARNLSLDLRAGG